MTTGNEQTTTAERYVPGTGARDRHTIVAIVNDRPGVLNRVASLARARNFNIESLTVGHTERSGISRMTITLNGDAFAVEQMSRQLQRLVDVLTVTSLPREGSVRHELALIKVAATTAQRGDVLKVAELYKAQIVDLGDESLIVEHAGTEQDIDALVGLLSAFGILEMVRTGAVAMGRGAAVIELDEVLRSGIVPAVPGD
jgi:acetolactate synthase-1/3 small subunit